MLADGITTKIRRLLLAFICMFTFSLYPLSSNQSAALVSSSLHFAVSAASFYHAYDVYNNVSSKLTKVPDIVKKFSSTVQDITETNTSFFYKLCSLGTVSLIAGIIDLYFAFRAPPVTISEEASEKTATVSLSNGCTSVSK